MMIMNDTPDFTSGLKLKTHYFESYTFDIWPVYPPMLIVSRALLSLLNSKWDKIVERWHFLKIEAFRRRVKH